MSYPNDSISDLYSILKLVNPNLHILAQKKSNVSHSAEQVVGFSVLKKSYIISLNIR